VIHELTLSDIHSHAVTTAYGLVAADALRDDCALYATLF
jgi:hypothetical protein